MGTDTSISWCTATWNPWRGCTKISPGCRNCYMFRGQRRRGWDPEVVMRSKTTFEDPLKWPKYESVFTCSWSDWFHPGADQWRQEAWDIIRDCYNHDFLILTKRPDLVLDRLPPDWGDGYTNVWLGVSVEYQQYVSRMRILEQVPVTNGPDGDQRFVSAEPLLGRVMIPDLTKWGWVIAGGESGPGHRYMDEDWVRELRDQCLSQGVLFHYKQRGGYRPGGVAELDGSEYRAVPYRHRNRAMA